KSRSSNCASRPKPWNPPSPVRQGFDRLNSSRNSVTQHSASSGDRHRPLYGGRFHENIIDQGICTMPSFDVVSEVDKHELSNAVDQANRELSTRFDFKGVDAKFELDDYTVSQSAPSVFQLNQMLDILRGRLAPTGIDIRCLDVGAPLENVAGARRKVTVKQGIEQAVSKKLIAEIKAAKLKVESQ